ncbi:MAG: adenosylmethionine--8-amino-7-oxononanoate transaminase [Gemmatirosa sp.]|nr:adenosylmethionine--8-amino-7-oxononanoate transaminase [Gemmatirosa sp.]
MPDHDRTANVSSGGGPDAQAADAAEALLTLDARHVWHPYTQHLHAPTPIAVARAEGAYLFDAAGRRILDAISSWWVTLHGHGQPEIADAIAAQARTLEQVIFAGCTHEPAVRLAAALARVAPPGLTRVFFSDDGSTAVEAAVKMALQYWDNRGTPRRLVAALEHAYHGDTFGAMSVSARSLFSGPFDRLLFDVARLPDPSEDADATLAAFDTLLDARGDALAALIVEPLVLGAGGMRTWPEAALGALAARCRARGVLLIVDEVMTGFGRTGPLFACQRADVAPDIMCVSKGITGGFLPLGATLATEAVFDAFLSDDRRRTLFHGHSYTANPIACAAALASLALLEAPASAAARARIEATHRRELPRVAEHPRVRSPRVLGTIAAFEIVAHEQGYLAGVGRALAAHALAEGVLLRPLGDTCYLLPPYCTSDDDLAHAYAVIAAFLARDDAAPG